MFGRRRRRQRTEVQILRARIDALESGLTPARAIDFLERSLTTALLRLENNNVGRDAVVEHLWQKLADQEHDLTSAIKQLIDLCDSVSERLDAQMHQEREFVEALRRGLQREEPASDRERVLGGSMFGGGAGAGPADVIEFDEPRRAEGWHHAS